MSGMQVGPSVAATYPLPAFSELLVKPTWRASVGYRAHAFIANALKDMSPQELSDWLEPVHLGTTYGVGDDNPASYARLTRQQEARTIVIILQEVSYFQVRCLPRAVLMR